MISAVFYPYEIALLSHIPVPALGEDKNEQPHVGRTLAERRSVTSLQCYHIASQRIQDFLEIFFMFFFQFKMR